MSGTELIADERKRQTEKLGWTPEHDDGHDGGQILDAAIAYAVAGLRQGRSPKADLDLVRLMYWPWEKKWWKPEDRERNLVKAGALIAAEIDRLARLKT